MVELFANSGGPDQKLCSAASDLGLHCLPNTLLGLSRLQWVKYTAFLKYTSHSTFSQPYLLLSILTNRAQLFKANDVVS